MKTILLFVVCMVISVIRLKAQVTQINNNNSLQVTVALAGKTIVVSDLDSSIWVTDATASGTVQISTAIKYEGYVGVLGDKFIFTGKTAATGSEIFVTNGTAAGTTLVRDIFPGPTGSLPGDEGSILGDYIYFTAETAGEGRELWRTNGTLAGTTLVKDILPGNTGSNLINQYQLFSNGSYLLFSAQSAGMGVELWKSDGTDVGTIPLLNINPGVASSNPRAFFKYNNIVLFVATTAAQGEEPWTTDGTPGGTTLIKDINPGNKGSTSLEILPGLSFPIFQFFHHFNNRVYLNAFDGTSTGQVWGTDGTMGNTALLKDIVPGASLSFILLVNAVNLPGKFIFPVSDGAGRSELWQSDGTTVGTTLFKAFTSNDPPEFPIIFLNINADLATGTLNYPLFQGNKFFFGAPSVAEGYELWVSDGTVMGTNLVKNINSGAANGVSLGDISWVYTTNELFFSADDGVNGIELWKSNGTEGGTTLVKDINPGADSSNPRLPFISNGKIIFTATDGNHPDFTDLFVIDGTFTILPVELLQFTVKPKGNDALIQWSTLHGKNSRDFTVQRSFDGQHFLDIALVQAPGNFDVRHDYLHVDAGVVNSGKSMVYYRLVASDKDGKSKITQVISLKLKGSGDWNVRLLSNPVRGNINVSLSGIIENLQLSIVDLNGKVVYKNALQQLNGLINLPAASLQKGVYLLVAETKNERKTIRFVK